MTSSELGGEHLHLLHTITDEDIARHRDEFKRLAPEYTGYVEKQTDTELRDSLARAAWLADLLTSKRDN